ncbi:MAG: hypothetical protein IJW76_01680 [Clostridia bacterium]|nr:hypothetical protein [Clostridia bacterium]
MEKDKRNCPEKDKRNLREHSIFPKIIFGQKNAPKIHISRQKQPKTPKIKITLPKIIFGGIFGGIQGGISMRAKNFKGGKCTKIKIKKCEEVIRTYDKIQTPFLIFLFSNKERK